MKYEVVFDVCNKGYEAGPFVFGGFALFLVFLFLYKLKPGDSSKTKLKSPLVGVWFTGLWTLISFGGTFFEYRSVKTEAKNGLAKTITGEVTEFDPMPYGGHKSESFVVAGKRFSYSDFIVSPGFNQTSSHGGPIHAGLKVRIQYIDETITKIEVEKPIADEIKKIDRK